MATHDTTTPRHRITAVVALLATTASALVLTAFALLATASPATAQPTPTPPADCATTPTNPACPSPPVPLPLPTGDPHPPLLPVPPTTSTPTIPTEPLPPGLDEMCKSPDMQKLPICMPGQPGLDPNTPSLLPGGLVDGIPGSEYFFGGSQNKMMPTLLDGTLDFSRFDLGYDPGSITDTDRWDDRFFGMLTRLGFALHTWLVGISTWLVGQAVSFDLADYVMQPVNELAATWQKLIVDRLGLATFAGVLCMFVAGTMMLSGRLGAGAMELFTSLTAGAIFVAVMANPGATLLGEDGLLGKTREFSLQAAAITLTDNPDQKLVREGQISGPLITGIGYALVVQPHMILNWGRSLDAGTDQTKYTSCLMAYRQLVQQGPHGTDDKPRDDMRKAGVDCQPLADFNAEAGPERLLGTVAVGFGAVVLIVLLALLSISLALAQMTLGGAAVATPFVLVSAYLPRGGRSLLWWWLIVIASAAFLVFGLIGGLAFLIKMIIGIFQATNNTSLIMRFVVFDVLVIGGFVFHRKIKRGAGRVATSLVSKLVRASSGPPGGRGGFGAMGGGGGMGGGASLAPWAAGGAGLATGLATQRMLFEGRQEFRSLSRPVRRGLRFSRRITRRAARTAPGRFVTGRARAGRQRLVGARNAALRTAKNSAAGVKNAGITFAQTQAIHGRMLAGQAGKTATAAMRRRGQAVRAWLAPTYPATPRPTPGYWTPAGVVPATGVRPSGLRRGSRAPGHSPGRGAHSSGTTADRSGRERLARRLADKQAVITSEVRAHAARGRERDASVSSGYNTPYGSSNPGDTSRTGLRTPTPPTSRTGAPAAAAGTGSGRRASPSTARRSRVRHTINPGG